MAGKVADKVNNMFSSIGAIQTLVENFPMSLFSFGKLEFATSFDVIAILFKMLGVDREELIEMLTDLLTGDKENDSDGFISVVETVVKTALELNIMGLLNCTVNPIISNKLLDRYEELNVEKSGDGILLNVSEIDFTGVLNKNPFDETESKFYFDVEDYSAGSIWKSKDFNAFLWYIINMSDKSQNEEVIWDNRISLEKSNNKNSNRKEILRCTYIDESFPNSDKLRVQICGGRNENGSFVGKNYYKTRKLIKGDNEFALNKTIFEFNHDFLWNIKLYDRKVIIAEIVEYLLGPGNLSMNIGFSINEEIIQGKIQSIIAKVIEADDMEVEDCFFSFSNDEYNEMLEKSEKNRYNVVKGTDGYYEVNTNDILKNLNGVNSSSELVSDKSAIKKTFRDITATAAQDPSSTVGFGISYDWEFELMRMLVYPFVRPLFTPKVIFLLLVNKKVMGSFTENDAIDLDTLLNDLMNSLFAIIKDIAKRLKDLIIEMMINYVLEKLSPLIALFTSRLLLESLKAYKDLLEEILKNCKIPTFNKLVGVIDDVNYADIIPTQVESNQSTC